MLRKTIQRTLRVALWAVLLWFAGVLLLPPAVTWLAQRYVPRWLDGLAGGVGMVRLRVEDAGWRSTVVSALSAGPPAAPLAEIGSLRLAYTLGGLYRRRIRDLELADGSLYLNRSNGVWRLRGLDALLAAQPAGTQRGGAWPQLLIDSVRLARGRILFVDGHYAETLFADAMARVELTPEALFASGKVMLRGFGVKGQLAFETRLANGHVDVRLASQALTYTAPGGSPELFIKDARLAIKGDVQGGGSLTASARLAMAGFEKAEVTLTLAAGLSADGRREGTLRIESGWDGDVAFGDVYLGQVALILPFSAQMDAETAPTGSLHVASIRLPGGSSGSYRGSARLAGTAVAIAGTLQFAEALRLPLTVRLGLLDEAGQAVPGLTVQAEVTERSDFSELWQGPGPLHVQGRLSAAVLADTQPPRFRATAAFEHINYQPADLTLQGVRTQFDGVLGSSLRSDPSRPLAVDVVSAGALRLENVLLRYQYEENSALFIEDGRFDWCGGVVYIYPMRLMAGLNDISVQLFCSRLELKQVLSQLGMNVASGEGELNGRIPIRVRNNSIAIENGYLYTKPGAGGAIAIEGLSGLAAGLPPSAPQAGQIALTAEALKSFAYEWLTFDFATIGEDLVMALKVYGRPSAPLPFEYVKETGTYTRIKGKVSAGLMRTMQLDLNFKVPLNKILRSGIKISEWLNL